ncbi:T9SS type A sorting domain-containing protein [Brumimicrobium aurantiacum]|uniref:T9SS C-terminal target domain-containing protein n=1 Tax=Brumimicrobium aurantiacum TaxID=1737063 RepID=A0A3E1EUA6_9FLAO|nr:T9SS type A sorting domain-containing protein [Brumimicrobium aurantiacum]RFC53137.1 T9SS C-terminal target domain-containing protein [Brumimicrobium aurantiacum]
MTYVPDGDNCTQGATYHWMDGNTPIGVPQSNSSLTVSTTGFYWVKVISANGCEYSSPTQIKPLFQTLPNVKLIGESNYCVNEDILFSVSTNATDIEWKLDGVLEPSLDDLIEADFTGLSSGNYDVSVTVTSANGCTNSATMNFSVVDPLAAISINETYSCTPYNVVLDAIPSPSNPNITYNWSNGASTQSISVPDGGPYRVTASLGGCSISKQVDIPKNPEDYLWIYPSGCYTDCFAKKEEEYGYLIGPTLPLPSWSWNNYGSPVQSGLNSFQTPFYLLGDGSYTSTINTEHCMAESDPLEYSLIDCEKCEIEDVKIEDVYQNNTPYCSFTYQVMIYSSTSVPFSATIADNFNNVSIIPSTFMLNPGPNYLSFTVIPQNPFTFGVTDWTIQGAIFKDDHYVLCTYGLRVEIPKCGNSAYYSKKIKVGDSSELDVEEILNVYPNPAKETATIYYEISSEEGGLEVYDLSGRSVAKHNLRSAKGEVPLNTGKYQAGVYIVVLRQSNGHTLQQKLVIE